MNVVLSIATVLFETIILFMFYGQFMEWKKEDKIFTFISVSVIFTMTIANSVVIKPPFITSIFTIIICIIAAQFFRAYVMRKIFSVSVFVVLAMVSELLTSSIMVWLEIGTVSSLMASDSIARMVGTIASKIVFLLLLRLIMLFDLRKRESIYVSYCIWLLSVPVMNITMLMAACYFFTGINYETSIPFTVITVCSMYINILVFYLFEKIVDISDLKNKNDILKDQIVFQEKQSKHEKCEAQKLVSIRHDIKTHFQLLYDMLKKGYSAEAEQYVLDIGIIDRNVQEWVDTGNIALDAVLNAKISSAKEKGINVSINISVPDDLKISSIDLGILFGNLLDNAIESCERVSDSHKEIFLYITYKRNHIICRMENSVSENVNKKSSILESSKKGGFHGIGIVNINNIVEKYNGAVKFYIEQNAFISELSVWNV